ncbi:MAG: hypothetical protein ACREBR_01045, partial [bacterium]
MKRREDDSRDKKNESSLKQSDKPPQFSGKRKDWFEFRRAFRAYLSTMKNMDGIPLTYVIRTMDEVPEGDDFIVARIQSAPLQDETFNSDNYDVFQTLSSFMRKSSAFVHIQDEEPNGRAAWLKLLTFYQSQKAKVAIVANADYVIKNTKYTGEKRNFRFEDYTVKFIQAFQEKKTSGEEVQGAQQVRAFVEGIMHEKMLDLAMPLLNHERYEHDLSKLASQLADLARIKGILTANKVDDNRKIGAASSQGHNDRKGGYKKRGGRSGRGGRGRGKGNAKEPNYENDYIPKSLFDSLSPQQRKWIKDGRDLNSARSIGAAKGAPKNDADYEDNEEEQEESSASSQFGREGRDRSLQGSKKQRKQKSFASTQRRVAGTVSSRYESPSDYDLRARMECDSRADTVCAGATFVPMELTGKVCDVRGFHDSFNNLKDIPVATTATAYDHEGLQETLILVVHESLYFGTSMEHSLISPNQLRSNNLVVDTCPRQYSQGSSLHGIYSSEDDVFLPFEMHGCISYLPTRLPTTDELGRCRYIYMTREDEWDPYSEQFKTNENAFGHKTVTLNQTAHENHNIYGRIVNATSSMARRSDVDAPTLAKRWGLSQFVGNQTLKATTQRGIRNLLSSIDRRYRTRQSQLRYPYLRTHFYSDTMFSDVKSLRGNLRAQVFVTAEDFNKVYPMKLKSEAGDKLNEFVKDVGIPELVVTDNTGEETGADWERVRKHYLIKQKWTEPYSPWQNKAEREIQNLKKQFRLVMNRVRAPDTLWDFGLKFVSDIRLYTSRASLDFRTPYEVLKGNTPDISELMDFDFYQWVKFNEPAASFTEQRVVLGRWLGVAHDVGQAMCYWILKDNGRIVARTTVRALT